jgi:hypothetical protein
MESLANFVMVLLAAIYGSGVIALALAWQRNRVAMIISRVFAFMSMATGFWLGFTLMNSNGLAVGGIPVLLGTAALVISLRRNR